MEKFLFPSSHDILQVSETFQISDLQLVQASPSISKLLTPRLVEPQGLYREDVFGSETTTIVLNLQMTLTPVDSYRIVYTPQGGQATTFEIAVEELSENKILIPNINPLLSYRGTIVAMSNDPSYLDSDATEWYSPFQRLNFLLAEIGQDIEVDSDLDEDGRVVFPIHIKRAYLERILYDRDLVQLNLSVVARARNAFTRGIFPLLLQNRWTIAELLAMNFSADGQLTVRLKGMGSSRVVLGTDYTFSVHVIFNDSNIYSTPSFSFREEMNVLKPKLRKPTVQEIELDVSSKSVTVSWNQALVSPNATGYRIALRNRDTGESSPSVSYLFSDPPPRYPLVPGQTYSLSIRAQNAFDNNLRRSDPLLFRFVAQDALPSLKAEIFSLEIDANRMQITWQYSSESLLALQRPRVEHILFEVVPQVPDEAPRYTHISAVSDQSISFESILPRTSYFLNIVAQAEGYLDSPATTQAFTIGEVTLSSVRGLQFSEGSRGIFVTWDPQQSGAATVYVFSINGSISHEVATSRGSYLFSGLEPDTIYSLGYFARARKYSDSPASSQRRRTLALLPGMEALHLSPPMLTIETLESEHVVVSWHTVPSAMAYTVNLTDFLLNQETRTISLDGGTTSLVLDGLSANRKYEATVVASAANYISSETRVLFMTLLPRLPELSGFTIMADTVTATISWNTSQGGEASTYQISLNGGEVADVAVSEEFYIFKGLIMETSYTVRIVAQAEGFRDSEPYETNFETRRDSIDRIKFRVWVFLQGAMESKASGVYMRTGLVLRGHLPASSALVRPWPGLPPGIEAVEVLPANRDAMNTGVMNRVLAGAPEGGRIGIVDWVMVEVRIVNRGDAAPLRLTDAKRVQKTYALLRSDGHIVNADAENLLATDGVFEVSGLDFSISTEDLYVAINHRNHVDVISLIAAAAAGANIYQYDFTLEGSDDIMSLKAGVWTLSAGDHNGDGGIDSADRSAQAEEFGATGYLSGDINLDADVNLNDRSMLINSYGKSQLLSSQ